MLKLYQICSYSFKNDAVCKYRFSTINILPKACFSDLLRKKTSLTLQMWLQVFLITF